MRLLYVLFAVLITAVSLRAQSYQPNLTLSSNSPACNGQSFQINAGRSIPPSGTTLSFRWSGPNSFTSNSFSILTVPASATSAGIYSLTMTFSGTNNGVATASTTVNLGTPKPEAWIFDGQFYTPNGISVCGPASLSLAAFPDRVFSANAASYQWTGPNGFISTEQRPVVSSGVAGLYIVEATYPNGCGTGKDTVSVTSFAPTVYVEPFDASLCPGTSVEFRGSTSRPPAGTTTAYQWSGPNGFTSSAQNFTLTNLTTSMAGSYSVTATFSGACSVTAATSGRVRVGAPNLGAFSSSADSDGSSSVSTFCPGSDFNVSAFSSSAQTYQWRGPNGFASTTQRFTLTNATSAMSGIYSVTATFPGGCSNTGVATVTIGEPTLFVNVSAPAAIPTYMSSFCPGTSARLLASVSNGTRATYQWRGPNGFTSTAQSFTLTNLTTTMTGTYSVTATFTGACAGTVLTQTQTVQVGPPSVFAGSGSIDGSGTGNFDTFCPGTAFRVAASPIGAGISYRWSGPNSFTSTTQSFTLTNATAAMSGAYSVTATFTGGCSNTAVASVIIATPIIYVTSRTVGINPVNTWAFCPGAAFELSVSPSNGASITYQWRGPNGFTSTAPSFTLTNATATMTGAYSVTATYSGACLGTSTSSGYVEIGINVPSIITSRTLNSPNYPTTLTASGCRGYEEQVIWSTGVGGNTIIVAPAQSMTYSAVCRLINGGCGGAPSNVVSVTVTNAPPVDLRLSMLVSTRTPEVNKPVRVTVLVENRSNQDATNVQWRCRLPSYLSFVAQEPGVVHAAGVVTGNPAIIADNSTLPFSFTVMPTINARYRLASQISMADNPDPEATPNYGTNSGQKYVAWADFRTTGAAIDTTLSSPEPNPARLPPVASNQPTVAAGFSDLSLGIQTSTLTPALNGEITVTVRIASQGYYFEERAQVRCQLPVGMSFVSSSDFTASGNVLTSTSRTVYTYGSTSLTFRARVNQPGQATIQAEIFSMGRPDHDSTPNNGYDNGEDDTAQVSLRTLMQ